MAKAMFILPDFFPLGSFGRLIKFYEYPNHSYHDPPYANVPKGNPTIRVTWSGTTQWRMATRVT